MRGRCAGGARAVCRSGREGAEDGVAGLEQDDEGEDAGADDDPVDLQEERGAIGGALRSGFGGEDFDQESEPEIAGGWPVVRRVGVVGVARSGDTSHVGACLCLAQATMGEVRGRSPFRCRWMALALVACFGPGGCRRGSEDRSAAVMVIETSPNNLDLRVGTDAQSERVGGLIFDALVRKDAQFELRPWLAERWEQTDAVTWVFPLRDGVRFHNGRPLEGEDVAWTIRSMVDGSLVTAKGGAFASVERVEVPERLTVVVRLKRPDAGLLFNMSDGLFGVVPRGSGKDFGLHPVGSGPFRFVSAVQDKEVVTERNHDYWADRVRGGVRGREAGPSTALRSGRDDTFSPPSAAMGGGRDDTISGPSAGVRSGRDDTFSGPSAAVDLGRDDGPGGVAEEFGLGEMPVGARRIERLRFAVVPDAITTALELKKGSADAESNVITLDMVHALRDSPGLGTEAGPSSVVIYANFNVTDPVLRDKRVRQAVACAMDRGAIIGALWRGQATAATSLLPPGHWARAGDGEMAVYPHDVERSRRLLDDAGFRPGKDGIRLRITLKTSTDETTRLMAAVMQQQMRAAGIDLQIRSAEFGTFYADVTKGAFQMYALRWIGSNEDPDIFRYAYGSDAMPPRGGNRGRYSNPKVDALLREAAGATDREVRRRDYVEVQKILAEDLPGIPLWYPNNEVVHARRMGGIRQDPRGTFGFRRGAWLR